MKHLRAAQLLLLSTLSSVIAGPSVFADTIDPSKGKSSADGNTAWYDCQDIGIEGKGWPETPTFYRRLPTKSEKTAPPKDWGLSNRTAGMCVRFSTDAPSLQIRWTLADPDLAMPHMP